MPSFVSVVSMWWSRNPARPSRPASPDAPGSRAVSVVALAVSAWALVSCDESTPPGREVSAMPIARGALQGYNVLVVTLDTVRADHLGCYGYRAAETPVIDGLAGRGVRVTDAVTPVPITLPAHASLFTGLVPPDHGVRLNGVHHLDDRVTTLAERLSGAGYATAAFVAASVLERSRGLAQGFDVYDDQLSDDPRAQRGSAERPADRVTDAALSWLNSNVIDMIDRQPFFVWVHYFDAHDPYAPPSPFDASFADAPYDGEIAFVDRELGRLLAALDSGGVGDRTLIVVTADHGEGLGEHGERTHAHLVYESTMHVPLILVPGNAMNAPATLSGRVVTTCDVFPTVLDLLGMTHDTSGEALSLLDPPPDEPRTVYLETLWPHLMHGWAPIHALRRHGDKFIDAPWPEYYDLARDRDERKNLLAGDAPPTVSEMPRAAAELQFELTERVAAHAAPQHAEAIDEDMRRRLMSLGYVMGDDAGTAPETREFEPTPLGTMIERWQARSDSILHSSEMQVANMLEMQLRSVALTPGDPEAHHGLGETYVVMNRWKDAALAFERAVTLDSTRVLSWLRLAEARGATNDWDGFDAAVAGARRASPGDYRVAILEGRRALAIGAYRDALEAFRRAESQAPRTEKARVTPWIDRARRRLGGG